MEKDLSNIPVKKKRGRPPLNSSEKKTDPVKKKRGRKPKDKVTENVLPKKRGRKPKLLNNVINVKKDITKEEQIIVHLPIKNLDLDIDNSNMYDSITPIPYNSYSLNESLKKVNKPNESNINSNNDDTDKDDNESSFTTLVENTNDTDKELVNGEDNDIINKYNYLIDMYKNDDNMLISKNKILPIFIEYSVSNSQNKWPSSVNIDCLWCCHSFKNSPFGIPIKKNNNTIHMFGNFCSPECSAAYNFDIYSENNQIWERYSLINYLYKDKQSIKLAPPRLSLQKFGGRFSINEFRKYNSNYNKEFKLLLPPMISIIPAIEEINTNNNSNSIINSELKLKRSKPILNSNNTLESCMNLKYL